MTITNTQRSGTPPRNFTTGTFKDTGSVLKTILNLGFVPLYFKLFDTASTELSFELVSGMSGADGWKTANDGTLTFETSAMPELIEDYNSGAVDTWTVYEAGDTNGRMNLVNEVFTGVSIPAALVPSSSQMYWIAIG